MARRNIKIDLRLSEQEMERLRRDVARSGWSREKYLRALIEHSIIKEMPSMDLVAVLRNLQQINNNINQIARSVNAGIARPEDAKRGLYLLDQVYELMYQVAKK